MISDLKIGTLFERKGSEIGKIFVKVADPSTHWSDECTDYGDTEVRHVVDYQGAIEFAIWYTKNSEKEVQNAYKLYLKEKQKAASKR